MGFQIIAGNTLSPPPENVKAIELEHGSDAATLREQIEQHKNNVACFVTKASILMVRAGKLDATGQWRTQYRVKLPHCGTFQYRPKGILN